jgi:hypothetical protein
MALFLLENRDFLGFQMIFKVPLRILQIINPVDKMWHCDWPRDRCSDYHKVPSVVKNV